MHWAVEALGLLAAMLAGEVGTAQETSAVMRTTNSVDIQICVNTAFLTPQRSAFQQSLANYMMQMLQSNALYLDRQYTTNQGNLCFLYVYQAPNPSYAAQVLETLTAQNSVSVPFSDTNIVCSVAAAQWSGDDLSTLGAPFPGLWTVNDLVLWGSCLLALLFLCMAGVCCFALCKVYRAPRSKEHTVHLDQQAKTKALHMMPARSSKRHPLDIQLDNVLTFCDAFGPDVESGGQKDLERQQIVEDLHLLKNVLVSEGDAHAHQIEHAADELSAARGVLQLAGYPMPAMVLYQMTNAIHTDTDDALQDFCAPCLDVAYRVNGGASFTNRDSCLG